MTRILIFIRPHRLEQVKSAIAALGVSGMTVSDVRGTGNSEETAQWFAEGSVTPLPIRSRVEVVVPDDMKDPVIQAILTAAQSGESGDGKIFIQPVETSIRIRTGERGEAAI